MAIDQPTVSAVEARRSAKKEQQRGEEVDGLLELLVCVDDLLHLGSRHVCVECNDAVTVNTPFFTTI